MEAPTPVTRAMLEGLKDQPEALIELILQQAGLIGALQREIAALQAKLAELDGRGPPPAAPFRRRPEEKSAAPKRPGRPQGHPGVCRQKPERVDEEIEVKLGGECPHCRAELPEPSPLDQWIVELPPVAPHVTRLRTWSCVCPACQREVRSTHPRQVSGAGGAAGVQLGARALGVACALKHELGLPLRQTARVLEALCGLTFSPGGLALAFQRVAERLRGEYDALADQLRDGPVIHTDETSWWLGGKSAGLWVWCSRRHTFYRVVESRNRATFYEVLPADWAGTLVSDCLAVYDGATPVQQKCYAHHLKAVSEAVRAGAPDGAGSFIARCRHLLHTAMALKPAAATLAPEVFAERRRALDLAAHALLDDVLVDQPEAERVRRRLRKQLDHLFTFLDHPAVEATNNLAERQLRPAVIARKLSCGNKTRPGADAWQVLASLAATCRQQRTSFIDFVASRMAFAWG